MNRFSPPGCCGCTDGLCAALFLNPFVHLTVSTVAPTCFSYPRPFAAGCAAGSFQLQRTAVWPTGALFFTGGRTCSELDGRRVVHSFTSVWCDSGFLRGTVDVHSLDPFFFVPVQYRFDAPWQQLMAVPGNSLDPLHLDVTSFVFQSITCGVGTPSLRPQPGSLFALTL